MHAVSMLIAQSVAAGAPEGVAPSGLSRVVLLDLATWEWLRCLQLCAPGPRLDLRYHVEGVVMLMQQHDELGPPWLRASTEAMRLAVDPVRTGDSATDAGTAQAPRRAAPRTRALHVSEQAYLVLRRAQARATAPRPDFQHLLQGARVVLGQHPALLPDAVACARTAMRAHLDLLARTPVPPFPAENLR